MPNVKGVVLSDEPTENYHHTLQFSALQHLLTRFDFTAAQLYC